MTLLGLWIDDPPRTVAQPAYWDELRDIGVRCAAIMIDTAGAGWDLRYSDAQLDQVCRLALDRDIEVVLTTWPTPDQEDLRRVAEDMRRLLRLGTVGWEVDLEGQWKAGAVRGYASLAAAAAELADEMDRVRYDLDCRAEVTTHTGHHEHGAGARVALKADRFLSQAYSTRHDWRKLEVAWDSAMGPGRRQAAALAQARTIPGVSSGRPRVCVGLACWDQKWPAHTLEEALSVALEAALACDPPEVRYWSSKWLVGAHRRPAMLAAWRAATARLAA